MLLLSPLEFSKTCLHLDSVYISFLFYCCCISKSSSSCKDSLLACVVLCHWVIGSYVLGQSSILILNGQNVQKRIKNLFPDILSLEDKDITLPQNIWIWVPSDVASDHRIKSFIARLCTPWNIHYMLPLQCVTYINNTLQVIQVW
jgi:hypothetical protein